MGCSFFGRAISFINEYILFKASVLIHIHVCLLKYKEVSKLTTYFEPRCQRACFPPPPELSNLIIYKFLFRFFLQVLEKKPICTLIYEVSHIHICVSGL